MARPDFRATRRVASPRSASSPRRSSASSLPRAGGRAASATSRSRGSRRIPRTRALSSRSRPSRSWLRRSASTAFSSRSWCGRLARTSSSSSRANAAGGRRRSPGLPRSPRSWRISTTTSRWRSPIIENLQREDLSPLEEASMYDRMIKDHGYSVRKLAQKLGKDKGYLENRLRLADAPQEVRDLVSLRKDTLSHAYELMKVDDPKKRKRLAGQVARGELSLVKLREKIEGRPARVALEDEGLEPVSPPRRNCPGSRAAGPNRRRRPRPGEGPVPRRARRSHRSPPQPGVHHVRLSERSPEPGEVPHDLEAHPRERDHRGPGTWPPRVTHGSGHGSPRPSPARREEAGARAPASCCGGRPRRRAADRAGQCVGVGSGRLPGVTGDSPWPWFFLAIELT